MLAKIEAQKERIVSDIEQNIESEMAPDNPKIYIGLMDKENFPDNLFPSIEIKKFNCEDLMNAIQNKDYLFLNSLSKADSKDSNNKNFSLSFYVDEPYSKILHIIEEDKEYTGFITDDKGHELRFQFKVVLNNSFHDKEREIMKFYYKNNMSFSGIYNPYSRKVMDIAITNYISQIEKIGNIISINLGEFEQKYKVEKDKIPCWNVEIIKNASMQFSFHETKDCDIPYRLEIPLNEDYISIYSSDEANVLLQTIDYKGKFCFINTDKKIKYWDECRIYSTDTTNLIQGTINSQMSTYLSPFVPVTQRELEKNINLVCSSINLKFLGLTTTKNTDVKSISKYINDFKYLDPNKEVFDYFKNAPMRTGEIRLRKIDDNLFEDKVNFLLFYMKTHFPLIRWVDLYES